MFADGGLALAFEGGVDHGELPAGRGLAGPDGVLAAVEVEVFADVAGFVNAGEPGADAEIHVGEEAVLGVAGADADGAGIAAADFEIDVG